MTETPDYGAFDAAPSTASMSDLAGLARELQDAELTRAEQDAALKVTDKRIRHLREHAIPDLMAQLGLSEIALENGSKLTVSTNVRASIPQARKAAAMRWLHEHGLGDVVKHQVVVDAGKGDSSDLIAKIEDAGYMARDDQNVHPMTLKKVLRDLLAEGGDFPMELFGAYIVNEAKLSKPKKSTGDF